MKSVHSQGVVVWTFLLYFLASMVLIGWLFWPFMSTIVMAVVVTGLFGPLYRALGRWMKPYLASLLTCSVVFLVVFVPIVLLVGVLAGEAFGLYEAARGAVLSRPIQELFTGNRIVEWLNQFLSAYGLQLSGAAVNDALSELGKTVGFFLYRQANATASNILAFLLNFFFMLVIAFYLLVDGGRLVGFLTDLSPLPEEQDRQLIRKFKDMAGAILVGNGLGGIIQGVLGGGMFALFGLESPILWGVIMGLLAFLPIVGIGLVILPAAALLALNGRIGAGLVFVLFYGVVSFGIEYVFKPRLVGSKVQMHTLLVFLSIVGGLRLFGILGIIYGPLVVTAFLTLTDIYYTSYQHRQAGGGTPSPGP